MSDVSVPSYETVSSCLCRSQIALSAAEIHGVLCGFICGNAQLTAHDCLQSILVMIDLRETSLDNEVTDVLTQLYEVSHIQLASFTFEFKPLLPHDDCPLQQRAETLGLWCQGLLAGLALSHHTLNNVQSAELHEMLATLVKITAVDYVNVIDDEQHEMAFLDVLEYVRMATLFIHGLLNARVNR